MIGAVGDDDYGRQLLGGAESDGVDVSRIRVGSEPTGVALIVVDARGQNLIAVAPGANGEVAPAVVEAGAGSIRESDVLVAQLETPLAAITAAAGIAREAGVPFILNAAPARRDLDALLPLVTLLVVNESELAILLGRDVDEGKETDAARDLLGHGPDAVVVTLGARGAVVVDAARTLEVPSYPVDAVDCVAAGDAFVGAFAAGDRRTLKARLSREVYEGFESAIRERESKGETVESRFVSLDEANIIGAETGPGYVEMRSGTTE
jgi:ribokinase